MVDGLKVLDPERPIREADKLLRRSDCPLCANSDRSRHEADLTRSANYGSRSQMSILYVTRTFQARSVSIGEENEVCYGPRFAMKTH